MRVMVTGSSGRLGVALVRRLRERGDEVIGVDVRPGSTTTHVADVGEMDVVPMLRGVAAIVHTAALHAPHVGVESRERFASVNVAATARLLEAAVGAGVGRFVYTSSTSVYGHALVPTDGAVWVTEDLVARPRDVYDETKLAAEALCARTVATLPTICLRVCRYFDEPADVMARHRLHRGADLRDIVEGHVLALDRPDVTGVLVLAARSPFHREDCRRLLIAAPEVIAQRLPAIVPQFAARGWALPERIDRVYVIDRAADVLGYAPRWNALEYFIR